MTDSIGDDAAGPEPGSTDAPPTAHPLTDPTPTARQVDTAPGRTLAVVDWISFVHLGLGLLVVIALVGFARSAADSLTKIVIGGVLALALDIPTRRLQKWRLSRGAAATIVCVGLLVGMTAVIALLGPPAIKEAAAFGDEVPTTMAQFYDFPVVGGQLRDADLAGRAEAWLNSVPGSITADGVSNVVARVIGALTGVVQVLLVTLALLLDGELLVKRARRAIPARLRSQASTAADLVYDTVGRYFAGSLLLAVANGLYILAVGLILGVPLILLAAVWVMITNLIPQIGGFLGGAVFVTLALTGGAFTGAVAAVLFIAYMSAENYVISPAVVGKAVNLSPPTTMIAAIVGGTAAGVPGALVATPLAGSIKALYMAARHANSGR
ncbi:MAG: AI-2E family transporter [Acidimicrobiales bacterium]